MINLEDLVKIQLELSKRLSLEDKMNIHSAQTFGGIDSTFVEIDGKRTIGLSCITIMDKNLNLISATYGQAYIDMPYIPTFLAFREIPVIMKAYQKLRKKPDIFILDGQGILHPRKMGIASHFGTLTNSITIGCGKSHLYGKYDDPPNEPLAYRYVYVDGEVRGYALRVKKNTNPVFISPGNNISIQSSLYVIIKLLKGYKLPEPVRLAHNLLKEYRKNFIKEDVV